MKNTFKLLILLILAGYTSATCESSYDYCYNLTLNDMQVSFGTGALDQYDTVTVDLYKILGETNLDGNQYVWKNLTNVAVTVHNTTTLYDLYINNQTTNNSVGCSPSLPACNPIKYDRYMFVLTANTLFYGFNSSDPGYATFCINGSGFTKTYAYSASYANTANSIRYKQPALTDFQSYYRRKWTFRDESNNQIVNFTGHDSTLTIWCNTLTELTYNMTVLLPDGGTYTFQTIEEPKYILTYDTNPNSIRQDVDHYLADDYYIKTNGILHTMTLSDYSGGQFYRSVLEVRRNINDTIGIVHSERFDQSNTQFVNLLNNTQYSIYVRSDTDSRDLGNLYINGLDTDKQVIVTTPSFTDEKGNFRTLNISINTNYNASQLSCAYSSENEDVSYVEFIVYNVTTLGNVWTYTTGNSVSNKSGTLTYTVPNRNSTYYGVCSVLNTAGENLTYKENINFRDETRFWKGFDLDIPSIILGISRDFFYRLLSLIIILSVAALFSVFSLGIGVMAATFTMLLFYYVGWFIVPTFFIAYIGFLGVLMILSQNRRSVIT